MASNLFKRGEFWWASFRMGGKRFRFSTHKGSRVEAKAVVKAAMEKERARLAASKAEAETRGGGGGQAHLAVLVERYCDRLEADGDTQKYIVAVRRYLTRALAFTGWGYAAELVERGERGLDEWVVHLRLKRGLSAKTVNDYRDALVTFAGWLKRMKYIAATPFDEGSSRLRVLDAGGFRALSELEIDRLLSSVPAYRARVYQVALSTGMRRAELVRLRWSDVVLGGGVAGRVIFRASEVKSRRDQSVPLSRATAAIFAAMLAERAGLAEGTRADGTAWKNHPLWGRVFVRVYAGDLKSCVPTEQTVREDMTAAGIPPLDDRGMKASLHAMRATLGTRLGEMSVPVRSAQQMLRHANASTTMKSYQDGARLDASRALPAIESFERGPNGGSIGVIANPGSIDAGVVEAAGRNSAATEAATNWATEGATGGKGAARMGVNSSVGRAVLDTCPAGVETGVGATGAGGKGRLGGAGGGGLGSGRGGRGGRAGDGEAAREATGDGGGVGGGGVGGGGVEDPRDWRLVPLGDPLPDFRRRGGPYDKIVRYLATALPVPGAVPGSGSPTLRGAGGVKGKKATVVKASRGAAGGGRAGGGRGGKKGGRA